MNFIFLFDFKDQDLKDELDNSVAEVKKTLSMLQTSERVIFYAFL